MATKYNNLPFCKGFGVMNWVFHYEFWLSAVGAMDRDRSDTSDRYDLTAFPPSMAVIADQSLCRARSGIRNDGKYLK